MPICSRTSTQRHSHCMLAMLFVRCQEVCHAAGCLEQVTAGTLPCLHDGLSCSHVRREVRQVPLFSH